MESEGINSIKINVLSVVTVRFDINKTTKSFIKFLAVSGDFLVVKYDIVPQNLKLEITETAIAMDVQRQLDLIERLRCFGFVVEMDDFGSGYSSLNMLSSLPIDALKMDMKFIQNAAADNREFRLIELILDIAEFLGVPVIAEGVETENQMTMLKDAGCDLVQGYYFSKPIPHSYP